MEKKSLFGYFWECLTKKYCSFSGRARRKEFWSFVLFYYLISTAIQLPLTIINIREALSHPYQQQPAISIDFRPYIIGIVLGLIFLLPSLGVSTRRLHDTGRSGWYLLPIYILSFSFLALSFAKSAIVFMPQYRERLALILILSAVFSLLLLGYAIFLLVLMCQPGKPGVNKYGLNPKEEEFQNLVENISNQEL